MSKSHERRTRSERNDIAITFMAKIDESCSNFATLRTSYKNICDHGCTNNDDDNVPVTHLHAN